MRTLGTTITGYRGGLMHILSLYLATTAPGRWSQANMTPWTHGPMYRRVRIKRPGFGDNRTPLNRGVGARSVSAAGKAVNINDRL